MQQALFSRLTQSLSVALLGVVALNIVLVIRAYELGAAPFAPSSDEPFPVQDELSGSVDTSDLADDEDARLKYQRLLEELAEARRREATLSAQVEDERLRVEPDFDVMKAAALQALRATVEEGPMATDLDPMRASMAVFSRYEVEMKRAGYAAYLERLDIDPGLRAQIYDAFLERDLRNNELARLRSQAAITVSEYDDLQDNRSDEEIASTVLDSEQLENFVSIREESLDARNLALTANMIISRTSAMTQSAKRLLVEAYYATTEQYPEGESLSTLSPDERRAFLERRIDDVDSIRSLLAETVSPRDLLYAEIFLEQQRLLSERSLAELDQ